MGAIGASQPDDEMRAIGASQPDVEMTDIGASQPGVSAPGASISTAAQPDAPPAVVREILELGRFPVRHKQPANDTEVQEKKLAIKLFKPIQTMFQSWKSGFAVAFAET